MTARVTVAVSMVTVKVVVTPDALARTAMSRLVAVVLMVSVLPPVAVAVKPVSEAALDVTGRGVVA